MNKPITVARADFAAAVVDAVKGAGLPAFVMARVLRDILAQLEREEIKQYKTDRQAWERAQAEEDRKDAGDDQ